jgi:hypothetical protein
MWIAPASSHACWCSSAIVRDFVIFDAILAPSYNITISPHGGGPIAKMISLDDDEEHIQKVLTKSRWST